MDELSRGVVLHLIKYSDSAFIAHVFTEREGCQPFLVGISHARRAAVRYTLFQPLALLELGWTRRPGAEMCRPTQARVAVPFTSLPFDPYKSAIAMFLAEFLRYALRGEPASAYLFEYVFRSVEWLDAAERDFANFHLVFLLRLTRFLGFFPDVGGARPDCYFDLQSCQFTPVRPVHGQFLEPADAARLPVLLRMRYENMRLFRFSGQERNRILGAINDFYRLHVPGFPELKSLSVLRELFH